MNSRTIAKKRISQTLYLSVLILVGISQTLWAQVSPREAELYQIGKELELRSDSLLPGLRQTATLTVSEVSLSDFLRGIAQTHRLNISIDASVTQKISNNFTAVKVTDLLLFLCREYQLTIRFTGSILTFSPYQPPAQIKPAPQVKSVQLQYNASANTLTADLLSDSLSSFAKRITQISKKNVILSPSLANRLVSGYVEAMDFDAALDKIAYANGLKVQKTEDQAYLLEAADATNRPRNSSFSGTRSSAAINGSPSNSPANALANPSQGELTVEVRSGTDGKKYISLDAANVAIVDIINEVSARLNINYVLFSPLAATTTTRLQKVSYDDLLSFLLQGSTHTHRVVEGIYLIGERNVEGFRNTRLVKLLYRPVEKIDESIPAELKKGVDIKLFKELNGVILSGGAPQLEELTQFLKAIDQPVLNVLIEVMVVELNKSHAVETGLSAILSDSAKATGGTLFPGINMTLGARGINSFLQQLQSRGLVNIGRVTPNFYLTLKALEQNNYVNIRSTPKLSTLNGHEATLTIGQSVYYLEQTQNITGGVTPINSVSQQFKKVDANLVLKINPMVSGDEHITLDIGAEFSDFVAPVISGAPPGNATRKFTSMIRVKNDEMIILGGLEEVRTTRGGSGVPLLSRLPVLKWLFSSRKQEHSDKRLLVFIKPTLMY